MTAPSRLRPVDPRANAPFAWLENTSAGIETPLNWLLESLNWLLESDFHLRCRNRAPPDARARLWRNDSDGWTSFNADRYCSVEIEPPRRKGPTTGVLMMS